MKRPLKQFWLILVLALVLLISVVLYNFYPVLMMKPSETGRIPGTNVHAVKNNRNAVYFYYI